jgi:hypothetical protein
LEPGQEHFFPGYGKVNSLQLLKDEIIIILPSKIIHIPILNVKEGKAYGYSRSMKHIQYFGGQWYGVSNNEVFFVLKPDPNLEGELIDVSFFTVNKTHLYDKMIATDNHLIVRYTDTNGGSGISVFFFYDPEFFELKEDSVRQVIRQRLLPQLGMLISFR